MRARFIYTFISILILKPFPAFASPEVIQCNFNQGEKAEIKFRTSINLDGRAVTSGTFEGKKFDCEYEIKRMNYEPYAVIPIIEVRLIRTTCKNFTNNGSSHLRRAVNLEVVKKGGAYQCRENLLVSYPTGDDFHPLYQGKEVALLNQKYLKGQSQ